MRKGNMLWKHYNEFNEHKKKWVKICIEMSLGIDGKLRSSCTSDDDSVMCLMKKQRVLSVIDEEVLNWKWHILMYLWKG